MNTSLFVYCPDVIETEMDKHMLTIVVRQNGYADDVRLTISADDEASDEIRAKCRAIHEAVKAVEVDHE